MFGYFARLSVSVVLLCGLLTGCPAPMDAVDGVDGVDGGNNNGGDPASTPDPANLAAGADALEKAVFSIIAVRVEDRARIAATEKSRSRSQSILDLFSGPCLNGGTRSTNPDGVMTFQGCELFPGLELDGGIRFVPDARGGQGGRIDFFDLHGSWDGNEFRIDGSMEEIVDEDGGLTFRMDIHSSTDDGEYNDEFNIRGEIHVTPDDGVFGEMRVDTGDKFDFQRPSRCRFDGQNIFEVFGDPAAFENLCLEEEFSPISSIETGIADDPAGVALASQILVDIDRDENVLEVLEPSENVQDTLFGLEFENARVYAQMDWANLNLIGISVENLDGQLLYTLENRYRGLRMTTGAGDILELDVTEGGAVDAFMTLNSTSPASRLAIRIDASGQAFVNQTRTQLYFEPNPNYGLKKTGPPAKWRDRAAGIRMNRSSCLELIGNVRWLGNGACDLKDLFSGVVFERVPEAICVASRALANATLPQGQVTGSFNLSMTFWCTVIKGIGLGANFAASLTPAELLCKALSISGDLSLIGVEKTLETAICEVITQGDWYPDNILVIGFLNADGTTEEDAGATEDVRIIPFGVDAGHPTFEWAEHLTPRAEYVIVTAESEDGSEMDLLYWLAREPKTPAIPRIVQYGFYNKGVKGVSNVPYPTPGLKVLEPDWFYRVRVLLDSGERIETRFRLVDSRQGILTGSVGEVTGKERTLLFGNRIVTEPVVDATVQVLSAGQRIIGEATTDVNGDYRIGSLVQGASVTVRVVKEGYAASQHEQVLIKEIGTTGLNVKLSVNNSCASDLGVAEPIRGALRQERGVNLLTTSVGEGVDHTAAMICVSGSRSKVVVRFNAAWVPEFMRTTGRDNIVEFGYSDAQLRVVGIRLYPAGGLPGDSIAAEFNNEGLPSTITLEKRDESPLLVAGREYTILLDVFAGSLLTISTEPTLTFRAR